MNTIIEVAMNFENLGARITENKAQDRKIWALEALKGNMHGLFRRFWGICGILEWLESESAFLRMRKMGFGPTGPSEGWQPVKQGGLVRGRLSHLSQTEERFQMEN
jgi:hypothetical protein